MTHWQAEWAVQPGFVIERDTEGYQWPSAIAFVPRPGSRPDDPLYFVTELRGEVKVVTNSREVHPFAEIPLNVAPLRELPSTAGEMGVAGICLDAIHGYVFVTLAYRDDKGILRNSIIRFTSRPGTFSLRPSAVTNFAEIFSKDVSASGHQIGGCQVRDGALYVSVGDAFQHSRSRDLQSSLGKILRLSIDGQPFRDNPFYRGARKDDMRNYVWAYGFRNPFGIEIVDGRVFVAENGPGVDRFLEIRRGEGYLWDGTDWSIGTNALAVFSPAIAPVQLAYYPGPSPDIPQEYRGAFFMAVSAGTLRAAPTRTGTGIVALRGDWRRGRLAAVPRYLVKYRGQAMQMVVGVAVGPDGLYFAPLYPDRGGGSAIYRVKLARGRVYPTILGLDSDPLELMRTKGCLGCHAINEDGGVMAPPLDPTPLVERLFDRLHSKEYARAAEELDRHDARRDTRFPLARKKVLAARGLDRVRIWLVQKIQIPRFDDPAAHMPQLDISDEEAARIADFLLQGAETRLSLATLRRRLPPPRHRHTVGAFAAGALFTLAGVAIARSRRL